LREDDILAGRVMWTKAGLIGIRFDTVLTRQNIRDVVGAELRRPRVPRIPVSSAGMLRIGARNYRAVLSDISP